MRRTHSVDGQIAGVDADLVDTRATAVTVVGVISAVAVSGPAVRARPGARHVQVTSMPIATRSGVEVLRGDRRFAGAQIHVLGSNRKCHATPCC